MKLPNNLDIDAALKVYESQGFNEFQLRQIKGGLLSGLDASIYAKKSHSYHLMYLAQLLLSVHVNIDHCVIDNRLDVKLLLIEYHRQLKLGKVQRLAPLDYNLIIMRPYENEESE